MSNALNSPRILCQQCMRHEGSGVYVSAHDLTTLRTQLATMTAERDRLQTCLGDCMQAAIQATAQPRQPLSEWIACDDRLPENDTHCFVVGPRFNDYRRGQYTAEALFIDGQFLSHDEGDDLYTPSHWFPIPTLPAAPERAITGASRE